MQPLISLAYARQAIAGSTDTDNALLETLIDSASHAVETWCHRSFASNDYIDTLNGNRSNLLLLANYPLQSLGRVATATAVGLSIENTDPEMNQLATVTVYPSGLALHRIASGISQPESTLAWSEYVTVLDIANGVNGLGAGWKATAENKFQQWPSRDLVPGGSYSVCGQAARLTIYDTTISVSHYEAPSGIVYGSFPPGFQNIRVEYRAGYDTIPADVQEACAQLVAHWYRQTRRDADLKRERLGDYSYERSVDRDHLPRAVRRLLDPYRNVRVD